MNGSYLPTQILFARWLEDIRHAASIPLDQSLPLGEKIIGSFRTASTLASHSVAQSQATKPEVLTAWGTGQACLVVAIAALTLELGNVGHFTPHLLLGGEEQRCWQKCLGSSLTAFQETGAEFPESRSLCKVAVNAGGTLLSAGTSSPPCMWQTNE